MTGPVASRIGVPFPTDQSLDPIAFFHAGAFKHPVIRVGADPVACANATLSVPPTHEQCCVWCRWNLVFNAALGVA